jgi:hypothetical protein
MFTTSILSIIFLVAFFSAENIVTVLIGGVISMGLSQLVKNGTGAYGAAMLVLAIAVSLVVAFVALAVSAMFNGTPIDWSALPHYGTQLFALATIGYKLLLADDSPNT